MNLIDKEKEEIEDDEGPYDHLTDQGIELSIDYISRQKIYTVPVVRCKDCIFYHKEECPMDDFHFSETKDDDFCSFGRREKDATD